MSSSTSNAPVVCVFCASADGLPGIAKSEISHIKAARELAYILHKNNITIVYGGSTNGLMGEVARTLVALSGPDAVHGITPKALRQNNHGDEGAMTEIFGRLTVVDDMHMTKDSTLQEVLNGGPGSGFIALGGASGTIRELLKVFNWNKLGIQGRGVAVFNIEGFYDGLFQWLKTPPQIGYVTEVNSSILVEAKTAEEAVEALQKHKVGGTKVILNWTE